MSKMGIGNAENQTFLTAPSTSAMEIDEISCKQSPPVACFKGHQSCKHWSSFLERVRNKRQFSGNFSCGGGSPEINQAKQGFSIENDQNGLGDESFCPHTCDCLLCVCIQCNTIICAGPICFTKGYFNATGMSKIFIGVLNGTCTTGKFAFELLRSESVLKPSTTSELLKNRCFALRRGLCNLGNTCFINCIIQVLVHTSMIYNLLAVNEAETRRVLRNSTTLHRYNKGHVQALGIISVFKEILKEFQVDNRRPIVPRKLVASIYEHMPHLIRYQQQDAHEFFLAILNLLHMDLIRDKPLPRRRRKKETDSLIDQIFLGRLQSQVTCTACGHSRFTIEPFRGASLEFVEDTPDVIITLENLLAQFTRLEHLGEAAQLFCPCCNKNTLSTRQLRFTKLPQSVCLHLKRFQLDPKEYDEFHKLETTVKVPERLNFAPFESEENVEPEPISECCMELESPRPEVENWYSLYAIIKHVGNYGSGHYVTYIREHSHWFKYNDHRITKVSQEEALNSEGYLLFYRKGNCALEQFPVCF